MLKNTKNYILLCLAAIPLVGVCAGLTQEGVPLTKPVSLTTYGFDVATKQGLKSIVPKQFKLYIHQSVQLPVTMSWSMDESWVAVLEKMATKNGFSVYINWISSEIFIRSDEQQAEDLARTQEIKQAAVTPLPSFQVQKTSTAPLKDKESTLNSSGSEVKGQPPLSVELSDKEVSTPLKGSNPATENTLLKSVTSKKEDVPKDNTKLSSEKILDNQAKAILNNPAALEEQASVNSSRAQKEVIPKKVSVVQSAQLGGYSSRQESVRLTIQKVANTFNYKLYWELNDFAFKGLVTVLQNSVDEDVFLVQKALGLKSPVKMEVDHTKKTIRVTLKAHSNLTGYTLIDNFEENQLNNKDPLIEGPNKESAKNLTLKVEALKFNKDERLENILFNYCNLNGITLDWHIAGGFILSDSGIFNNISAIDNIKNLLEGVGINYTFEQNHLTIISYKP